MASNLEGQTALVRPGRWQLVVNGQEVAEVEAVGEQIPKGAFSTHRVISYKGSIDTAALDLAANEVLLIKMG